MAEVSELEDEELQVSELEDEDEDDADEDEDDADEEEEDEDEEDEENDEEEDEDEEDEEVEDEEEKEEGAVMDFCHYSEKYADAVFEYRHVKIPFSWVSKVPWDRMLTEEEWRALGVHQSRGWIHYARHKPEPHILLFRRPLPENVEKVEKVKVEADN